MNAATPDLAYACRLALWAQSKAGHGRFAQTYHLMPAAGWLNDPNGLHQKDGVYHAYYQASPLNADGGLKFWGHAVSRDLVRWEDQGIVLFPDSRFDCHGVYSGSALPFEDGVAVFYTGNVKHDDLGASHDFVGSGRESNTLLAFSHDGQTFTSKRRVLSNADYPSDVTCHVRDPKVYDSANLDVSPDAPRHLMLLGARRAGDTRGHDVGEVLLYGADDLSSWRLLNRITTPERFGFMWECPDYLELGGTEATLETGRTAAERRRALASDPFIKLLAVSPQGLEGPEWEGGNVYQSGWFELVGDLTGDGELGEFHLWDGGFDFYAPQTFEAEDGRRILIGWMGIPDTPSEHNLTVADGWQHCFTVPREVVLDVTGGRRRVLTRPVAELEGFRRHGVHGRDALRLDATPCFDLSVTGVGEECSVRLAGGLTVSYEEEACELVMAFEDRDPDGLGGGRGERRMKVGGLESLRVLGDASSVEVFANGGEQVMSCRYYPERYSVEVAAPGASIDAWQLSVPQTAGFSLVESKSA